MCITMAMMDAARVYMEVTNSITFHYHLSPMAVPFALRIREANGNVSAAVVKRIADEVLLKVAELLAV